MIWLFIIIGIIVYLGIGVAVAPPFLRWSKPIVSDSRYAREPVSDGAIGATLLSWPLVIFFTLFATGLVWAMYLGADLFAWMGRRARR